MDACGGGSAPLHERSWEFFPTWYRCAGVKIKYGDLVLRLISFLTEEFAADITVEGINVLRVPAGEGKVSSFECFPLIGRNILQIKYGNLVSVKLREKTLAIDHQFVKFANVFSRQRFLLYGSVHVYNYNFNFVTTFDKVVDKVVTGLLQFQKQGYHTVVTML